ncbi:MAG: SEC-C metal-binding domain-containing protein [bacterium]
MPSKTPPPNAFTLKANAGNRLRVLITPVEFTLPSDTANKKKCQGIWDTGATGTVISQSIVDALNLKPIGITFVNTASEQNVPTPGYLVDVHLYDGKVCIKDVRVTLGSISGGADCLIGMDIITLGDFAVTNVNGTTFSFRIPSMQEIDYVQEANRFAPKVGRNDPCPCGSGKKYKLCHGVGK